MIPLIVVEGPTASGKTSLAIEIAKALNGEIVSADSMQIYKHMDIATAKPSVDEMQNIPHHLLDFLDISEKYSVSDYVNDATTAINNIVSRSKIPILCGGTGLYIDTLVKGIDFTSSGENSKIREQLSEIYDQNGGEVLWEKLNKLDPEYAQKVHPNNKVRLIRALEIYESDGLTMSEQYKNSRKDSPYDLCRIYLEFQDRSKLYERINLRVDKMIERGLEEEARDILSRDTSITAKNAIGYKELRLYFDGFQSFDDAVKMIKQSSRRYAKRQITWFKREPDLYKFSPDTMTQSELVHECINTIINRYERNEYFCLVTKRL